jgi:predicted GNAT family N-acyltransferase
LSADCRLTLTVREARDRSEIDEALALRVRVFCGEQGVSEEEELDGLDDAATQVVGLDESGVVATCRLRFFGDDCKLERMAVSSRARGLGAGARLLARSEEIARERGSKRMVLNAQTRVRGFYGASGYEPEGDLFMEANIEHVRMAKAIEPAG